jgi:uncharacterized glyoxalase superfamily protein PhnB
MTLNRIAARDCRTPGKTPLHRAASYGTRGSTAPLLDAGAQLDKVATPIHDAFWWDRVGVLSGRFGISWMLSFR